MTRRQAEALERILHKIENDDCTIDCMGITRVEVSENDYFVAASITTDVVENRQNSYNQRDWLVFIGKNGGIKKATANYFAETTRDCTNYLK